MTSPIVPSVAALSVALTLVAAAAGAAPPTAGAPRAVLHCGRLLDVVAGELLAERTVVVEGGRIAAVEAGYRAADGAVVHDLRDATCLPGLMDAHVHFTSESTPTTYLDRYRWNAGDHAFRMVPRAEATLLAGFTTVRDLGDAFHLAIDLRDAIAAGVVPGPRILAAGKSIATTGGHADPTNALRDDLLAAPPTPREGVADGPLEARQAVRERYKEGADVVKITATGGVLSVAKSGHNPQFTEEEIRAVVEAARDYGFTVAAHAHGAEGIKRAVRAGVDSIEHGTLMDEEAIALMVEKGTYYVPTISAGRFVAEMAAVEGFYPDLVRPKAAAIGPQIQATAGRAYRAGVTLAFGTDAGVGPHGENAREFVYMVEAGIPPLAALRSATTTTARLFGLERDLGTLEPGKIADVVAVPGDPLQDVAVMLTPIFVMKDGVVYRNDR